MNTTTILLLTGCTVFVIYNILAWLLNGRETPESISSTSYLSKEKFGTTLPFTMICVVCSVCLLPAWISVSPTTWEFLTFLTCAGILFAGSTPLYREDLAKTVHYAGGIVAFVCGLLWLLATCQWISLAAITVIGGIWTLFEKSKYTWIFEFVGYLTVVLTVLSMT